MLTITQVAVCYPLDVADPASISELMVRLNMDKAIVGDRIDCLVHNAGLPMALLMQWPAPA